MGHSHQYPLRPPGVRGIRRASTDKPGNIRGKPGVWFGRRADHGSLVGDSDPVTADHRTLRIGCDRWIDHQLKSIDDA